MANRPTVGVTGNARRWSPSWWCTRLALWLAGARAVRISVRHPVTAGKLDALVIGGGDDIHPEHYNGDLRQPVKADPPRDHLEIEWIHTALKHRLPVLGICRGAQLLNVVLGGNLHQDIRAMRKLTHNRPGLLPTKQVELVPHSELANIYNSTRLRVNSLHYQAIRHTGAGLLVVARDRDNITQAVEFAAGHRIIGVQWHPEYLFYLPSQFALFRWLLDSIE